MEIDVQWGAARTRPHPLLHFLRTLALASLALTAAGLLLIPHLHPRGVREPSLATLCYRYQDRVRPYWKPLRTRWSCRYVEDDFSETGVHCRTHGSPEDPYLGDEPAPEWFDPDEGPGLYRGGWCDLTPPPGPGESRTCPATLPARVVGIFLLAAVLSGFAPAWRSWLQRNRV